MCFCFFFTICQKPIPLCYLTHLTCIHVIHFLPAEGRYLFVFFPQCSQTFCALLVFLFLKEHHQISQSPPTHTPLVAHLAGPEASVDSHAKKEAQCRMLSSLQLIHIKCCDAVCNNNRPCSSFSQCNHTWASGPCYPAVYIVFPLLTAAYYLMDHTLLWSPWWSLCFCLPACFIKKVSHVGNWVIPMLINRCLCHRKSFSKPVKKCNWLLSLYRHHCEKFSGSCWAVLWSISVELSPHGQGVAISRFSGHLPHLGRTSSHKS